MRDHLKRGTKACTEGWALLPLLPPEVLEAEREAERQENRAKKAKGLPVMSGPPARMQRAEAAAA